MKEDLTKFNNWLEVNGKADNTVTAYCQKVRDFLIAISGKELTEEVISDYILSLKDKVSVSTRNLVRNAIRSYLEFKKVDISLPKNLKPIKTLPSYIPLEKFQNEIIPTVELIFEDSLKTKALLYFWYFTGLRKSEILLLKRKNFDFENRTVKIQIPKTKEERIVCYTDTVKIYVEQYFLTETEEDNAFNLSQMKIKYIFFKLNQYVTDVKLYPHIMRHSYASHLLKQGMDLKSVQDLLGHASINSTIRYTKLNTKDIQEKYDKYIS